MDAGEIRAKIKELEEQLEQLRKQAESSLAFLSGKIEAYREVLADMEQGDKG